MIKVITIVQLYGNVYDPPPTFKLNLNGDVHPFIIAQHIFKTGHVDNEISFQKLYETLINLFENDADSCVLVEGKYENFLVALYTESYEHNAHITVLDLYEDGIYPFTYFSVNHNLLLNTKDLFSERLAKREVLDYVNKELFAVDNTYTICSQKTAIMRDQLDIMLDKHDHFKFLDKFEITAHTVTRLSQLEDLGIL